MEILKNLVQQKLKEPIILPKNILSNLYEILDIIKNLSKRKSLRHDFITNTILKKSKNILIYII